MKKLVLLILVGCFTTFLFAKEIDLTQSKGTDQEVIVSLLPAPAQIDVDQSVIIKAVFNVELDASHIKKNNIRLKKFSFFDKNIKGSVSYKADEKAVIFQPEILLSEGYYELTVQGLKALKKDKETHIKEIKYRFYVPEVVDDHKLPPKPDMRVNNATVAGIDANSNGVRDDIERWIYLDMKTYRYPKVERAIALQKGKALQKILIDPENARNLYQDSDKASNCFWYYKLGYLGGNMQMYPIGYVIFDDEYRDIAMNTKERQKAYYRYNLLLSGDIYPMGKLHPDQCDFDIETMMKEAGR